MSSCIHRYLPDYIPIIWPTLCIYLPFFLKSKNPRFLNFFWTVLKKSQHKNNVCCIFWIRISFSVRKFQFLVIYKKNLKNHRFLHDFIWNIVTNIDDIFLLYCFHQIKHICRKGGDWRRRGIIFFYFFWLNATAYTNPPLCGVGCLLKNWVGSIRSGWLNFFSGVAFSMDGVNWQVSYLSL